jgi:ABC-2 type transport system permease protein
MSVDSVIHDIGYQRYTGPRLGRGYAFTSLFLHGLRTGYGLGRPAKAKIFPWAVAFIVTVVAVVLTAIRAQTGEVALSYPQYTEQMGLMAILYVAIVAPELVSRDLRSGVLPLYFTRALSAADYALAKLAALISALWLLLGGPQLIMFLGGAFGTDDGMKGVWNEFTDLLSGLVYAGVHAMVFAALALLIASLTGKRAFAAGGIVAAFLVTAPVVGLLSVNNNPQAVRDLAGVFSPASLVQGVGDWFFETDAMQVGDYGPVYGLVAVAFIAACAVLLLARYRKVATR